MDTTFFTKYLPIEGEIKEGDYYLSHGKDIIKCSREPYENAKTLAIENEIHSAGHKKVKLFLCSRDIRDEEKVYHNTLGPVYTGYISDKTGKMDVKKALDSEEDEEYSIDIQDLFKVIGEISSKATWVKEGNKFRRDQIKYDILDTKFPDQDMLDIDDIERYTYIYLYNRPDRFKLRIRLKGPCGHFH